MRLCPKCRKKMDETLTKQNVVIDTCSECRGVWLDEGEINFLASEREKLFKFYSQGLKDPKESSWLCPRCPNTKLFTGKMPEYGFLAENCPRCKGIFLDELELNMLTRGGLRPRTPEKKVPAFLAAALPATRLPALPSLGAASLGVLCFIYALLFGVLLLLVHFKQLPDFTVAPIMIGVIALQFLIGPWLMDLSLSWLGSLNWVELSALPKSVEAFVRETCAKNNLPLPTLGIIEDDAPNAFTYGRTPKSARLVITRGILNNLSEEEVKAVIGHELGHVAHYDFIVMTLAQLVPVLLYEIYRFCERIAKSKGKSEKNDPRGYFYLVAMVSYLAYLISYYTVLYLSRIREYWADRFGAAAVGNPNHLSSALVKIGYGLAYGPNRKEKYGSTSALGIFDPQQASVMSLYVDTEKHDLSDARAQEAMQWDLWNPWASYYELQSTHPLIAKRINALGVQARTMNINPEIVFDLKQPESYWDDFLVDLFMMGLPLLGAFAGGIAAALTHGQLGFIALGLGFTYLLQLNYSYPKHDGSLFSVAALLKKIKVSKVRGIPVKVKGTVVGRGDPGNVMNEDFYLRDQTGLIFLDYNQPLAIFNFLFGVFRRQSYDGAEVEVTGWYRRAPVPYIEIWHIEGAVSSLSSTAFTYRAKQLLAFVLLVIGFVALLNLR